MRNKILIILACLVCLISCETVEYITPKLPAFNPVRPERPQLEEVNEDVPLGAIINTVRLMEYSQQLEVYSDSWETFYNNLAEDINGV